MPKVRVRTLRLREGSPLGRSDQKRFADETTLSLRFRGSSVHGVGSGPVHFASGYWMILRTSTTMRSSSTWEYCQDSQRAANMIARLPANKLTYAAGPTCRPDSKSPYFSCMLQKRVTNASIFEYNYDEMDWRRTAEHHTR